MNKLFWNGHSKPPAFEAMLDWKEEYFHWKVVSLFLLQKRWLCIVTEIPCLAFSQLDWILAAI